MDLGYSQRASEHARSVNATLIAHYGNAHAAAAAYKGKGIELTRDAQSRVHALSSNMLTELEKLQVCRSTVLLPHSSLSSNHYHYQCHVSF